MGMPMARNLVRAGHDVAAYNRTRSKADELAKDGARTADTPAAAAEGAEVVITMLADDHAVEDVVFGEDGFDDALAEGAVHVSMSTISVELSRMLADAHRTRGQRYVSAPVFGRPDAAEATKLRVVAAGAAEDIDLCRPLFAAMAQETFVAGTDPAAANVVKLAGNFLIASVIGALGEAFAFGRKQDVEADTLLEILGGSLLRGPIFENYAKQIAAQRYEPAGFKLKLGLKDMGLVLAAAGDAAVPMPIASALRDRLLTGVAQGHGDIDWSGAARLAAEAAGLDAD
jgi:3-hydroxyisobutyrate dehydrogenase-like beta-hydroxyacid dehydrogenase